VNILNNILGNIPKVRFMQTILFSVRKYIFSKFSGNSILGFGDLKEFGFCWKKSLPRCEIWLPVHFKIQGYNITDNWYLDLMHTLQKIVFVELGTLHFALFVCHLQICLFLLYALPRCYLKLNTFALPATYHFAWQISMCCHCSLWVKWRWCISLSIGELCTMRPLLPYLECSGSSLSPLYWVRRAHHPFCPHSY